MHFTKNTYYIYAIDILLYIGRLYRFSLLHHTGSVDFCCDSSLDRIVELAEDNGIESESDVSDYTESDEQEEHWEINVNDIVRDFDIDEDDENLKQSNDAAPAATTKHHLLSVILIFITL